MHENIAVRFWAKVERRGPDECWPWLASVTPQGYGKLWVNGRLVGAHVLSWEIDNQQAMPDWLQALHTCDNPPCVNPGHIWAGTQRENMQDAYAKVRRAPPRKPRREVCQRGHPMVGDNVYSRPDGTRRACRTCKNAYMKLYPKQTKHVFSA